MINVWLRNNSKFAICHLTINPAFEYKEYGYLEKDEISNFQSFYAAYETIRIHFFANGKEFELISFDHVGEVPMNKGFYTFIIEILDFDKGKAKVYLK